MGFRENIRHFEHSEEHAGGEEHERMHMIQKRPAEIRANGVMLTKCYRESSQILVAGSRFANSDSRLTILVAVMNAIPSSPMVT